MVLLLMYIEFGVFRPKNRHICFQNFVLNSPCEFNLFPIQKIFLKANYDKYDYCYRHEFIEINKQNENVLCVGMDCEEGRTSTNYIKLISQYVCNFTTTQSNSFNSGLVAKFYEIPYSGSLLFSHKGYEKTLKKRGFIHLENCLLCEPENYIEMSNFIVDLSNKEFIDTIRKRGMDHIQNHHTEIQRKEYLEYVFSSLIENIDLDMDKIDKLFPYQVCLP